MSNGVFIVKGIIADILEAEQKVPYKRPGSKAIPPWEKIYWNEATEEERQDKNIKWFNIENSSMQYFFKGRTPEQIEERKLDRKWRIEQMFDWLLNNKDYDTAMHFLEIKAEDIEELGIELNTHLPRCRYSIDKQCSLFCDFYEKGKCNYEDNL